MSNRPATSAGAGLLFESLLEKRKRSIGAAKQKRRALVGHTAACLASALLSVSMPARAADTQAQDVLRKMTAAYTLSAYQGTAVLNLKGISEDKKPFSVSGTQEVAYKSPNIFFIKAWGAAVGGTQIRAFDGKDRVYYDSTRNQYLKQSPPKGALPALSLFGIAVDAQTGKMTGSATVGGHEAYLIQAMMPMPAIRPNADAQEKAAIEAFKKTMQPFELAIDKKNYHLLRVVQVAPDGKSTKMLEFTQQTFNPTLADSAFVFTPPAGAHLVDPQHPNSVNGGAKAGVAASQPRRGVPNLPNASGKSGSSPVSPPHASPGANGTSIH